MKTHAIIPIFISHRGCPNDCVFCNQKKITARAGDVTPADVSKTVETWLTTLGTLEPQEIELAFFGGSFTGIPLEEQTAFLQIAKTYNLTYVAIPNRETTIDVHPTIQGHQYIANKLVNAIENP